MQLYKNTIINQCEHYCYYSLFFCGALEQFCIYATLFKINSFAFIVYTEYLILIYNEAWIILVQMKIFVYWNIPKDCEVFKWINSVLLVSVSSIFCYCTISWCLIVIFQYIVPKIYILIFCRFLRIYRGTNISIKEQIRLEYVWGFALLSIRECTHKWILFNDFQNR